MGRPTTYTAVEACGVEYVLQPIVGEGDHAAHVRLEGGAPRGAALERPEAEGAVHRARDQQLQRGQLLQAAHLVSGLPRK